MSGPYLLTIDCGTSNARSVVFNARTGEQVSIAQRDWYHKDSDIPGAVDFAATDNWKLICECVKESISKIDVKEIAAVTATSFRHGIICVNKEGKEVFGCINVDARAEKQVTDLVEQGLAPKIYEINGDWPNVQGLPRLIWIKENQPEVYQDISRMLMVSDWVIYRLSGEMVSEPSNASSTAMFDIKKRNWSEIIINLCNLRDDIYPEVVNTGTVVGKVTEEAAGQTGLLAGTPVVVGVGDTQAGLVGVGSVKNKDSTVVGGSFWLQTQLLDSPLLDPEMRLRTQCHCEPGQWLIEGCSFYVGLFVRWFRDAFCELEKLMEQKTGIDSYYFLDKMAEKVQPGANGMQVIFSDLTNMKSWKHAAPSFIGWDVLNPERSHKGVFFRAILENAALQTLGEYRNIKSVTGIWPEQITFCGGGAKSFIWPQILADVTGVEVRVPRIKEATALGAAIYAGQGVNLYQSVAEAMENIVQWEKNYKPDMQAHAIYAEMFTTWREIYGYALTMTEKGLTKPMWRAAGS
ncbi:MAG: autoinducer-2 kinase [Firmicutes bacterium]|nr:autoinducer-2 kinase [Bacillota bacterium]